MTQPTAMSLLVQAWALHGFLFYMQPFFTDHWIWVPIWTSVSGHKTIYCLRDFNFRLRARTTVQYFWLLCNITDDCLAIFCFTKRLIEKFHYLLSCRDSGGVRVELYVFWRKKKQSGAFPKTNQGFVRPIVGFTPHLSMKDAEAF